MLPRTPPERSPFPLTKLIGAPPDEAASSSTTESPSGRDDEDEQPTVSTSG